MFKEVIFIVGLMTVGYSLPQQYFADIDNHQFAPIPDVKRSAPVGVIPRGAAVDPNTKAILEYTWQQTLDQTNHSYRSADGTSVAGSVRTIKEKEKDDEFARTLIDVIASYISPEGALVKQSTKAGGREGNLVDFSIIFPEKKQP